MRCDRNGAITDNDAAEGGAAVIFEGTLSSEGCDFGVGATDNHPVDLRLLSSQVDLGFGARASFVCDGQACR